MIASGENRYCQRLKRFRNVAIQLRNRKTIRKFAWLRTRGESCRPDGHVVTVVRDTIPKHLRAHVLRTNDRDEDATHWLSLDTGSSLCLPRSHFLSMIRVRRRWRWWRFISSAGSSPSSSLFAGSGYVDHENARVEKALVGEGPIRASRGSARDHRQLDGRGRAWGKKSTREAKEKNHRREKPTRFKEKGEKKKNRGTVWR